MGNNGFIMIKNVHVIMAILIASPQLQLKIPLLEKDALVQLMARRNTERNGEIQKISVKRVNVIMARLHVVNDVHPKNAKTDRFSAEVSSQLLMSCYL